jgi:SAM-dependent methyltransferase
MMSALKQRARRFVPLSVRMQAAAWLTRQRWLPVSDHVAIGLIRDLQTSDPKRFHKFAWSHHLMGYARWYDSEAELFAREQMQPSRLELFADLRSVLERDLTMETASIASVLEVGCSQGYLLRHLETDVFPRCPDFVGIDIDAPAIEKGMRHLQRLGSRVQLLHGDMEHLDGLLGTRVFDVTIAAGVLSYLNEADATHVVGRLLRRTRTVLALAGLAHVGQPNRTLDQSVPSPTHEGQWIHNFEALAAAAGGRVVRNRWEGARLYNLQTLCFAFVVPGMSST